MYADMILFKEPEAKNSFLTIRLTSSQKARICDLANERRASITQFILGLIRNECASLDETGTNDTQTVKDPVADDTINNADSSIQSSDPDTIIGSNNLEANPPTLPDEEVKYDRDFW